MKPIKRGLLPDTVTICNARKDPDTGKVAHFRTRLSYHRYMTENQGLVSSKEAGATHEAAAEWWVDPVSSEGCDPLSGAAKHYAEPHIWETLDNAGAYWTLQEGDLAARGEVPGPGSVPGPVADILARPHFTVASVSPVFDKAGAVHHWEVALV